MEQLNRLKYRILTEGQDVVYRKGQVRRTLLGCQERFDLRNGNLPVETCRKPMIRGAIAELLWFLSGSTNIAELKALAGYNLGIWDDWANEEGSIGPMYGAQWRDFGGMALAGPEGALEIIDGVDQIKRLITNIQERPYSTDHIVSAWNPAHSPDPKKSYAQNVNEGRGALNPCHTLFQVHLMPIPFKERMMIWHDSSRYEATEAMMRAAPIFYEGFNQRPFEFVVDSLSENKVMLSEFRSMPTTLDYSAVRAALMMAASEGGIPLNYLTLQLYQRSCDVPIGGPVNITCYSLLAHLLAHCTGNMAREFIWDIGNAHIYHQHLEEVRALLANTPLPTPQVFLNPDKKNIFEFTPLDIQLIGLKHHPAHRFTVIS